MVGPLSVGMVLQYGGTGVGVGGAKQPRCVRQAVLACPFSQINGRNMSTLSHPTPCPLSHTMDMLTPRV